MKTLRVAAEASPSICIAVAFLLAACIPAYPQGTADLPSFELERQTLELGREFNERLTFVEPLLPLLAKPIPLEEPSSIPPDPSSARAVRRLYDAADLAALALQRNPALAEARALLAAAQADLGAARSARLPRIEGTAAATSLGNPMDAMSIQAGAFGYIPGIGALPGSDAIILEEQAPTWYQFKATLTQPLFTWGKTTAGIALADSAISIAALKLEKTQREILLRLGATLDGMAITMSLDEVLLLQSRIGERLIFISEQSLKAGFITAGDLFDTRIEVKELELARAELARSKASLLQDLRGLCGTPDLELASLSLSLPSAGTPRIQTSALVAAARVGSLDLALVTALQEAKKQGLLFSKASQSLKPSFAFRAELGYEGAAFPFLEEGWAQENDWQLSLSIASTLTLFDAGAARSATKRALAEIDVAQAQASSAQAQVDAFVQASIQTLDLSRARLEYDQLRLQGHADSLERQRKALLAGAGTESEYLRSQLDTLAGIAQGWTRILEYRGTLWSLEAVLSHP